jgi:rhodanese-related sulfurtransferase
MSSINTISPEKLARLVGTPHSPRIVDVRDEDDFAADPRLIPGSLRRASSEPWRWAGDIDGRGAVVVCQKGLKLSHGVAAWLRNEGVPAESLEGGFLAWHGAGFPSVPAEKLPPRDEKGRTVWVTREHAVFLFVEPSEVLAVAERFGATPFDVENVFWSHRGELCSFDVMVDEFGLKTEPLLRLAAIVRGADTARLDLAAEAAGLLAASLGLSRMFADDLAQLEAGLTLYDAFYRWCRDATEETHNWPSARPRKPT